MTRNAKRNMTNSVTQVSTASKVEASMDSRDLAVLETYLTPFSVAQADKLLTEEPI